MTWVPIFEVTVEPEARKSPPMRKVALVYDDGRSARFLRPEA